MGLSLTYSWIILVFLHMNSNQCVKVQAKISPHIFKLENAGQKRFDKMFWWGRRRWKGKKDRKEDGKVKKKVYSLQRLKGQSQEMNIFLKINEKTISTFWRSDLNEFKLDYLNCSTKNILPILKILLKTFFILITTFGDFLHSSQAGQRNDGENTTKIFSWLSGCFFHVQRHYSVNVFRLQIFDKRRLKDVFDAMFIITKRFYWSKYCF
jgi:hypothetical protein